MENPTKTDEWDDLMYELKKRKDERKKDEVRMKKKAKRLRLKKEGKNLDAIKEEDSSGTDKQ